MREQERIPYFGKESNCIREEINTSQIEDIITTDLYSFVMNHLENDTIFIINKYFYSYVSDIKFNYRDKRCFIPYYAYSLYPDRLLTVNDNNGHLIVEDDHRYVRYNFEYSELEVKLNTEYLVYSIRQRKKYKIIFNRYYTEIFSIEMLYKLYFNSCFKEDNFLVLKHEKGYHYINRVTDEYKNREKILRAKYELPEFKSNSYKDYRDVREYKYYDLLERVGLFTVDELYKYRRLRFESYLYCNLREENIPVDFDEWKELGKTKDYIKYIGEKEIPLFIKSYWLNDNLVTKKTRQRTYMRSEKWQDIE